MVWGQRIQPIITDLNTVEVINKGYVVISAASIALQEGTDYLDYVQEMLEKYENLGPLPGLFLPYMEAFLPFCLYLFLY